MDAEEVRKFDGQDVTIRLKPEANAGTEVRGRIVGFVEAADGMVVVTEPNGAPIGARVSTHYHHIDAITRVS
jgi:hypothetical protein